MLGARCRSGAPRGPGGTQGTPERAPPRGPQAPPLPASEGPISCGPGALLSGRGTEARPSPQHRAASRQQRPWNPDPAHGAQVPARPRIPAACLERAPVPAPDPRAPPGPGPGSPPCARSAPGPCAAWGSSCSRCVCKVSVGEGPASWARAGPLASGTQLWVSGGWGAQRGAVTGRAQGGRRNFKGELGRSRLGHFSSAGGVATHLPPEPWGDCPLRPEPPAWGAVT